jgi:hypothetical protein
MKTQRNWVVEIIGRRMMPRTEVADDFRSRPRPTRAVDPMFVDPSITVHFTKKNPTRCNNVSKFYYSIFIRSSTCFGRHTTHHQETKTPLAASEFLIRGRLLGVYLVDVVTHSMCLTTSTKYTSNSLLRMKNQRLPVQF